MTAALAAVADPAEMEATVSALDGGIEYLQSLQDLEPFTLLGIPVTQATLNVYPPLLTQRLLQYFSPMNPILLFVLVLYSSLGQG